MKVTNWLRSQVMKWTRLSDKPPLPSGHVAPKLGGPGGTLSRCGLMQQARDSSE
jgi:hypothetical protein